MTKLKKAIAYTRVSTEAQGKSGFGLEAQEVQIQAYARSAGFEILETFSDVASGVGSPLDRTEFPKAVDASKKNACPIIVATPCRFSRDPASLRDLPRKLNVIAADHGASSDDAAVRGQIARKEFERESLSQRTREGMAAAKARGAVFGNPNIKVAQQRGHARQGANADQYAGELSEHLSGIPDQFGMTARELVDALNARGILTPRGKPWTETNFRRVHMRVKKVDQRASAEFYEGNPLHGIF